MLWSHGLVSGQHDVKCFGHSGLGSESMKGL